GIPIKQTLTAGIEFKMQCKDRSRSYFVRIGPTQILNAKLPSWNSWNWTGGCALYKVLRSHRSRRRRGGHTGKKLLKLFPVLHQDFRRGVRSRQPDPMSPVLDSQTDRIILFKHCACRRGGRRAAVG